MLCLLLCFSSTTFAHSGRTDSNGGHRDNRNVSGLGYYHYHCGGNPAHLHPNGVCPYRSGSSSSSNSPANPAAKKPKLNRSKAKLAVGATLKLSIKNTGGRKVKWSSTKRKVATVNKSGKVTGKRNGTTTIKATVNGKTLRCKITVSMPKLNRTSVSGEVDDYIQLKVSKATAKIKWSSSNPTIAKVDSDGFVDFVSAGTAVITARTGTRKLTCKVTIYDYQDY